MIKNQSRGATPDITSKTYKTGAVTLQPDFIKSFTSTKKYTNPKPE